MHRGVIGYYRANCDAADHIQHRDRETGRIDWAPRHEGGTEVVREAALPLKHFRERTKREAECQRRSEDQVAHRRVAISEIDEVA